MLVYATSSGGARGVFQADVAAMVAVVAMAAFVIVAPGGRGLRVVGAGALLSGLVHAALVGGLDGVVAHALLTFAAGTVAAGVAGVGRAIGTGDVAAGAVASAVLWVAMTGLFWADGVSEALPASKRRDFRQAVVHADLATASAYGAAGFERMHDGPVYSRVPMASSLVGRPSAPHTASAWIAVGLVLCGAAWWIGAGPKAPHDDP